MTRRKRFDAEHDEVLCALAAIGNAKRGEAIRIDRGSQLRHLGIGFPALRARVKQGFSFSSRPEEQVLAIWDALWHHSPVGDVLFAAIEHCAPLARAPRRGGVPVALWARVRTWAVNVDNWCHSDALASLYSQLLEAQFDEVYPQLQAWNADEPLWLRRLSITSLVHYTGKNAIFLPPERMLPLLERCVGDDRRYIQLALGWVLRELGRVHAREAEQFLQANAARMGAVAWARALEKTAPAAKARLAMRRKATMGA